ncbi:MAG: NAD(P)/FAD-dependent oxidoreductase [Mycobacteriales bacterium]|nr:FAD-dependent oxidoreductase [Frankia sp.]
MSTLTRATDPRIVIIGAGPTGLGAGYRLNELGYDDWVIVEANDYVGGLATSFTDDAGFTYDIGGHVMFSHYRYYDELVERLMGDDYTVLNREAWVWMQERFIPYPFQTNIKDLEPETVLDCLMGVITAQRNEHSPTNFREWVLAVMGEGIAKHFMLPYNFKVWATPPELMNYVWIGERVATVNVEDLLRSVLFDKPETQWGPNSTFKYPLHGGTGFLYEGMRRYVEHKLELSCPVVSVDTVDKVVRTGDGRQWPYDVLLNTMPLNRLIASTQSVPDAVRRAARDLGWSGSHIVGIGVDRPALTSKNWIYFPEPDVPFYRVTYLSNYSPNLTPKPDQTIFLTETSHSRHKPEDATTIVDRVVDGLVETGLMEDGDRELVESRWLCSPAMSYPVPTVGRDNALGTIQTWLREQEVWSRGRFGAWLYEIGNMDHSAMQGVEFVNAVLHGEPETVWIPRGQGAAGVGIR